MHEHRRKVVPRHFKKHFNLGEKTVFSDFGDFLGVGNKPIDAEVVEAAVQKHARNSTGGAVHDVLDFVGRKELEVLETIKNN